MTDIHLSPKALMSLLANGAKAIDVLEAALAIGLLDALESGPVRLGQLSTRFGLRTVRLYKLLDCLESLGFVRRDERTDDINDAEYQALSGLREAVIEVVGPDAIERDRDKYPWRRLHGRLAETVRGQFSLTDEEFAWPPKTAGQIAEFERSMAAGLGPIIETFRAHAQRLWSGHHRLLDVGGGDGTLATHLLADAPDLRVDVYNLPAVGPLVDEVRLRSGHAARLGFVGGDFLADPLPHGYDAVAFVRVLHDWPVSTARRLIENAYQALLSGGCLLICEEFRNSERLAMQFFWSYFLIGVDSCFSRLREVSFYTSVLQEVGFEKVEVLPGRFELIIASKP